MATNLVSSHENTAAEEYIDMDISSATFLCYTICSPPQSSEFEFHMSSHPPQRETTTSPADELFYKGKLLPLHLPPRLQMVASLLQNSNANSDGDTVRIKDNVADTTTTAMTNTATVSAPSSCHVSGELNPEEYFIQCSSGLVESNNKRKWSEKLKRMRKSSLGLKYIKSLFTKSSEPSTISKAKAPSNVYRKAEKNPHMPVKSIEREEECTHRKSFSGAINWLLTAKSSPTISSCSSSSSPSFSSVNSGPFMLKRSSSVNSEVERPIEGAIAHCKKSQLPARKSASDVEYSSITGSKIVAACEIKERPGLCRG